MWRKIIDDYRLYYLNDLFEIKWIFLRSKSYVAIFSICMGAKLFSMRRLYQVSPRQTEPPLSRPNLRYAVNEP